jgi:hypothetical protein
MSDSARSSESLDAWGKTEDWRALRWSLDGEFVLDPNTSNFWSDQTMSRKIKYNKGFEAANIVQVETFRS